MAFFAGVALNENGEMGSGMGVDFGDYNNDSRLDIMVTNFQDEVATLYHNDGDGFFFRCFLYLWNRRKHLRIFGVGCLFLRL